MSFTRSWARLAALAVVIAGVTAWAFGPLTDSAPLQQQSSRAARQPKLLSEPRVSVAATASLHPIGAKEELDDLKRRLKGKKKEDQPPPDAGQSANQATPANAQAAPECRPDDVTVEIDKNSRPNGYKSLDFQVVLTSKHARPADVQLEFMAHSGGTGALGNHVQTVTVPKQRYPSYIYAQSARVLRCKWL